MINPSEIFELNYSSGKDFEEMILKGFLKRLSCKNVQVVRSERPDFFIKFDHTFIFGCEITIYFNDTSAKGSVQQRFISQWKSFVSKLHEKLKANNLENVYGAIHFKQSNYKINELNDISFINELVDLVNLNRDTNRIDYFHPTKHPISSNLIDHIYIKTVYPAKLWWPAHLQSGYVNDSKEALQSIINDKYLKSLKYDWKNAADRWLLIYAPCYGLADFAVFRDDIELTLPNGSFDRVYLWNKFDETINQILPEYKNILSCDNKRPLLYVKHLPVILKGYLNVHNGA